MSNKKLKVVSLAVLLSLTLSLIFPVGVLADGDQPPSPDTPEVVTPPEDVPAGSEPAVTEDAVPADGEPVVTENAAPADAEPAVTENAVPTDDEPAVTENAAPAEEPIVTEETQATETTASDAETQGITETTALTEEVLVSQLPEGTDVVVLDENGEAVPLASQEAADIMALPDPQFCPTGYLPGAPQCSAVRTTIQAAVNDAKAANTAGTVYIQSGTYNETVTIADFANALTLQGVFSLSPYTVLPSPANRPVINGQILLQDGADAGNVGNTANITLADLVINDHNNGGGDNPAIYANANTATLTFTNLDLNATSSGNSGLIVTNQSGNVFLTNVDASGTANRGASIDNTAGNSSVGVTVTGSVFNDNNSDGLYVRSDGTINLTDVTAGNANNTGNGGYGADIRNTTGNGSVNVTGGTFNDNNSDGLHIRSDGAISLTNVTAGNTNNTGNGGDGADLDNTTGNSSVGVTVTGGTFNDNNADGLHIRSDGAITLTNVTAGGGGNTGNGGNGADISSATGTGAVMVTGSVFNQNGNDGLLAVTSTNGSITISDTTFQGSTGSGDFNNYNGATLNSRTVTLTNVTANNNDLNGISISNATTVNLNNVVATNNGTTYTFWIFTNHLGSGIYVNGSGVAATVNVNGGTFSDNQRYGLEIGNAGTSDTIQVYSFPICTGNVLGCYSQSVVDNTDHTPPDVTPTVTGTLGSNGWYTDNVTVTWSVNDLESTITSPACTDQNVTADTAGVTFTCTATSAGGTTTTSVTIKRDATPPTIDFHADEVAEATGPGDAVVNYVSPNASDSLSGTDPTATCVPSSGGTFGLGDTTITCTATDAAGNVTTSSFVIHVVKSTENNSGGEQGGDEFATNNPLIPVTGAGEIALSCTAPFRTVENMAGFEVTFTSLCGYSAMLTEGKENSLSDLPNGDKFVGGINIALLKDGSLVDVLPVGSTIDLSFKIPSGMTGKTLVILFWDPTANNWVEKSLTIVDGKVTIAIAMPGTFVLVEK